MGRKCGFDFLLAGALLLGVAIGPARATTINFDNLNPGPQPGDAYAALGVTFATCLSPKAAPKAGDIITLTQCTDGFQILANSDAISPPNFAMAKAVPPNPKVGGGSVPRDVLMTFSSSVNFVELFSDKNPTESADVIRLIALEPTGTKDEYKVVKVKSGLDDKTGLMGDNRLGLASLTTFSAALFQTTTEKEGFDNLTFLPPDCNHRHVDLTCHEEIVVDPQWVPVGCEAFDCCPVCPGKLLDWNIFVKGDPMSSVILFFDNLSPDVARGLKVEGNAKLLDGRHLEIFGQGTTTVRGLRADPNAMLPAIISPRMSLERVKGVVLDRPVGDKKRVQRSGAVEITVEQTVDGRLIDKSQRVYRYWR